MILYAPIIDPIVPGFIYDENMINIKVQFKHNIAVG
jgi:hypothetical protein